MKKFKLIGCGIWVLLMSGCGADHSRHFTINIEADGTDPWVELQVDAIVEKAANAEESTSTVGVEGQATVPISGVSE